MEAACCNLVEPGDVVMVLCNGIWGQRFSEMAERHGDYLLYLWFTILHGAICSFRYLILSFLGGDVRKLTKPSGETFCLKDIEIVR